MNSFYFQDINPDSDLAILREGNFIKINGTEYEVSGSFIPENSNGNNARCARDVIMNVSRN